MNDDVTWLVAEVEALLRAGRVGLYEFVEILRQRYPDDPVSGLRPTCRAALDKLLADPAIHLGAYVWASSQDPDSATIADLQENTFDEIGDDPYLGIERT